MHTTDTGNCNWGQRARHVVAWLWLIASVLVVTWLGPALLNRLRPEPGQWTDFFQDWASARNALEGAPVYGSHQDAVRRYLGEDVAEGHSQLVQVSRVIRHNAHPPPAVLMVLPLAPLTYRDAVLVWNLVSLAALVGSLWIVQHQLGAVKSAQQAMAVVGALLVCGPLWTQIHLAQFNLVLLLLLCGAWAAERSGRPRLGAGLLGTAMAIKLFPGVLLVYYVVRRQWLFAAWSVLVFAACCALTVLVLGGDSVWDYRYVVLPNMEAYRSAWNNASLVGFWSKLFNPAGSTAPFLHVQPLVRSATAANVAIGVSCAAVAIGVARVAGAARTRSDQDHAFGLALIGMLLVSPVTWDHYLLLLLLPTALFLSAFSHLSLRGRIVLVVALLAVWMRPLPLYQFVLGGTTEVEVTPNAVATLTVLSYQCYALLALFLIGAARLCRSTHSGHTHARKLMQPMHAVLAN